MVFCRTNIDCNNLESYLNRLGGARKGYGGKMESGKENPYSCVVLAGARAQKERQANLESFKDGDVRLLICTDLAARGLDIAGLPFVVQMSLPDDIEQYIHRIGRCGRSGHMGLAIAIVSTQREKVWYHKCQSRGQNCIPKPGNTKLTIPFGPDKKVFNEDKARFYIDEGGCTIWYDEPDTLRQLEERIGRPVPAMDRSDFSVPGLLESPFGESKKTMEVDADKEPPSRRALKRKLEDPRAQAITYGAKRNDANLATNNSHASTIAPTVLELHCLETRVQQMFCRALWGDIKVEGFVDSSTAAAPMEVVESKAEAPVATQGDGKPLKKKVRW